VRALRQIAPSHWEHFQGRLPLRQFSAAAGAAAGWFEVPENTGKTPALGVYRQAQRIRHSDCLEGERSPDAAVHFILLFVGQ
jgi:hypothetical protein